MKDTIIVTTQEEMDAVIADASIAHRIEVRGNGLISVTPQCPLDVWVFDSVTVHAYGSSAVTAYDSSTVHAFDSSTVTAYDSSTAHAYGSHATIAGGVIIDHTTADALTITPTLERTNR